MGSIPPIAESRTSFRVPVSIPGYDYLLDHQYRGKPVLPAVEALQLLVDSTLSVVPDLNPYHMTDAAFDRFIFLPPPASMEAFNDITLHPGGRITATFITRTGSAKTGIKRAKPHVSVTFGKKQGGNALPLPWDMPSDIPLDLRAGLDGIAFSITPAQVYTDLVPFGPAYRNLIEKVFLSLNGAIAFLNAPCLSDTIPADTIPADIPPMPLGSPFPLDAAFHAACAWGQRYKKVVVFPIGFEKRIIHNPVRPGEMYAGRIMPKAWELCESLESWESGASGNLLFDIRISDMNGDPRESVINLVMADVSRGRLKPPDWIQPDRIKSDLPRIREAIQRHNGDFSIMELDTVMPFAANTLTPLEKKRFSGMGDRRKKSYLAARLTCKNLSRKLSGHDRHTPAHAIHTMMEDNIHPACPLTDGRHPHFCTVSHDKRFAIAASSDCPVGADVEMLSERALKSKYYYIRESENQLQAASALTEIELALRIWTIKECVAKALDINLTASWKRTEVINTGQHESRVRIDEKEYHAFHDTVDGHLFSIILIN